MGKQGKSAVELRERARVKELKREGPEAPGANEILRKTGAYFAQAATRLAHRSGDTIHRRPPRAVRRRVDLEAFITTLSFVALLHFVRCRAMRSELSYPNATRSYRVPQSPGFIIGPIVRFATNVILPSS